jgi:hypothetical protein
MNLHDDIVLRGVWIRDVRQGKSADAGSPVSNGDGLHESSLSAAESWSSPPG